MSASERTRPAAAPTPIDLEELAGHQLADDDLCRSAAARQLQPAEGAARRDTCLRYSLLQAQERGMREAHGLFVETGAIEKHEVVGPVHRQRPQQEAVGDAEHRRIGADADREREHRREREAGTACEHARAVSHVLPEVVDPARAARVARLLLDGIQAAEAGERQTPGLARRHPVSFQSPRFFLDVESQLGVELALESISTQQPHQPAHGSLRGLQDQANGLRQPPPIGDLLFEAPPARARDPVDLGGAPRLRLRPGRGEQPRVFEPMKRGIQGPLRHVEQRPRDLADALGNRVAMERVPRDDLQDEHVERALEQVGFVGVAYLGFYLSIGRMSRHSRLRGILQHGGHEESEVHEGAGAGRPDRPDNQRQRSGRPAPAFFMRFIPFMPLMS